MKKFFLAACLLMIQLQLLAQNVPSWVTTRPVSDDEYIGIGMTSLSEEDFQRKAVTNAMLEIVSQISLSIEATSFMRTVDVDGKSRTLFEEKVKESVADHIEGQKLKGTYSDSKHYYVYYELDKKEYQKLRRTRREDGISLGMDWYAKGAAAERNNSYAAAMQFYAKGLEAVQPYLYLDLVTEYNGRRFDVPAELYAAYLNVFSGISFLQNISELQVEAFKPSGQPLTVALSINGRPAPNVLLRAAFVTGAGELTAPVKTDADGVAVFYVRNVTSKEAIQAIEISLDDSFISSLPVAYRHLIDSRSWPSARFTAVMMNPVKTAFLSVENNDLPSALSQVRGVLANNYLEFTESQDADLFVTLSTKMDKGSMVQGQLSNMNEHFVTLELKIYDNHTRGLLLDYSVHSLKLFVPVDRSESQAKSMCVRELMRKVNRELPLKIKKMNVK